MPLIGQNNQLSSLLNKNINFFPGKQNQQSPPTEDQLSEFKDQVNGLQTDVEWLLQTFENLRTRMSSQILSLD